MENATWTIGPCSPDAVRALVEELGLSHDRRVGARPPRLRRSDPRAPRVPRGRAARATTRSRSATWAAAVERDPGCGRGGRARSACTATTTPTASAPPRSPSSCCASSAPSRPGTCRRGSRRATASHAETIARLAADGVEPGADRRLRHHRRRRGRARRSELGLERRRHRPPPARPRRSPTARSSRRSRATTRSPASAAPRVVWKLAEALLGPGHPFLDRHLDVVALATVADVVPLVDENRALAPLGLRRLAQTQKPGLRALMRVAGVDPAACDEGAIGFRLAPRINASGRLGRPEAALELLLTDDAAEAARLAERARGAEPRAAGRRGADPARGDRRDRVVAGGAPPPPRLRRRRRGLARGRDRHRRLAARRAVRPPGRADRRHGRATGRARGARPARSTCTARSPRASEHLERFGGHRAAAGLTIRPERVEAFAAAFAAHADARARPTRTCARGSPVDAVVPRRRARARRSARSSRGSRRSASATRA